ncbi:hypothetical protein [Paenibacillus swuensis]|nr:hypothetical protein [Paenibacillus swuensis]
MTLDIGLGLLLGWGAYYGFTVIPHFSFLGGTPEIAPVQRPGITAAIPFHLPSLQQLKIQLTPFKVEHIHMEWTVPMTILYILVHSYIRGMYIGGIHALVQGKPYNMLSGGRMFFKRMIGWTVFETFTGAIVFISALFLWPLGIVLSLLFLFFSLAPYLIIIQDLRVAKALNTSATYMKKYFSSFIPLVILALVCTLSISLISLLEEPINVYLVLILYSCTGTWLIYEFVKKLTDCLTKDGETIADYPAVAARYGRWAQGFSYVLLITLPLAGVYVAQGSYLTAFQPLQSMREMEGVGYSADYSEAYRLSKQSYHTYAWSQDSYRIRLNLPQWTVEDAPDELRGTGEILWSVDQDEYKNKGNTTYNTVENVKEKDRFFYRLSKEKGTDGSFYYSSLSGTAGLTTEDGDSRNVLDIKMMVSGDGKSVFIAQHPARFPVLEIPASSDGNYMLPAPSHVNPNEFKYYWFSNERTQEDIFTMLQAKNQTIHLSDGIPAQMIASLQEADGETLGKRLEYLRSRNMEVRGPDWSASEWTTYLRGLYRGADVTTVMTYLSRTGLTDGGYKGEVLSKNSDRVQKYKATLSFPNGEIVVVYTEKQGKLTGLSIQVPN